MTIYQKQNSVGVCWFRSCGGEKTTGNIALSAFAEKYSKISNAISNDIINNKIITLDIIKDVIIIETPNGFFVDNFQIDSDTNFPIPTNNYNNLLLYASGNSFGYWYNEYEQNIYTLTGGITGFPLNSDSVLHMKSYVYNLKTNLYVNIGEFFINIPTYTPINRIDPIRNFTYNPDTKTYNVSTLLGRVSSDNIGLISVDFKNNSNFSIDQINIINP